MFRRVRKTVCRLLIAILLFAQMAIAAYACPQLSSAGAGEASAMPAMESADISMSVADMGPHCPGMGQPDPDQPNLCVEQFHFGQQSDHTQTPILPAILLTVLYPLPLLLEPAARPRAAPAASGFLAAASPPHAILHCCFRV